MGRNKVLLASPGIESWWGRDSSYRSRMSLGPHQPPVKWVPHLFPEGKAVEAWHWPPTPSITEVKERVQLYLYSPLCAFVACPRVNGFFPIYICDFIAHVIRNTLCLHFHAVTDRVMQAVALLTWVWEMPAANTSTDTDYTNFNLSWLSQMRQTNAETTPNTDPNSLSSTFSSSLSIPYNF